MINGSTRLICSVIIALFVTAATAQAPQSEFAVWSGFDGKGDVTFCRLHIPTDRVDTFFSTPYDTNEAFSYVNDIIQDEQMVYLTAGSVIYKWDMAADSLVDTLLMPGVNRMAVYNDKLLIARWSPLDSLFFAIYDKNTLQEIYTDRVADNYLQDIAIIDDMAYVGNVNAFNRPPTSAGEIFVYDLAKDTFSRKITLNGTVAKIDRLYSGGDLLYALGGNGLAIYDTKQDTFVTFNTSRASACFGNPDIGISGNLILYQDNSGRTIGFDVSSRTQVTFNTYADCQQAGGVDEGQYLYNYDTDFFSSGSLQRISPTGTQELNIPTVWSGQSVHVYNVLVPETKDDLYQIFSRNGLLMPVLDNDPANPGQDIRLSIAVGSTLSSAGAIPQGDTAILYLPAVGVFGVDSFSYQSCNQYNMCDTAKVIVDYSTVSIGRAPAELPVRIFPNPAVSVINVLLSNDEAAELEIHDLQGKLVHRQLVEGRAEVSLAALKSGTYLVHIRADERLTQRRIVKY